MRAGLQFSRLSGAEDVRFRRGTVRISIPIFSLLLLFAGLARGQAQKFKGRTVISVQYLPARQPLDQHDLEAMQLVKPGNLLDLNQVATTIDNLWASGAYNDIQVDAEPSGKGVTIRFITKPRWFIGHVAAEGNIENPPSRSVVIADSLLTLGQPFNPDELETARQIIARELKHNGLYQGQVGVSYLRDPITHQVTIRFQVQAGKRARYTKPQITGDQKLSDDEIIDATGWQWPFIHWWRKITQSLTEKGIDGIQKRYAKANRLTATVDLKGITYDPITGRGQPELNIDAGPKIQLRALQAKVSKKKMRQLVPVYQEGSVDNDLLFEGQQNLRNYFQSKGYPDADVTFKREPLKSGEETINFYIALGPRRKLVHVGFTGSHYFERGTLTERMFLQTAGAILHRYGRYSEAFRNRDAETIAGLYRANGFLNVKVTSTVQTNYNGNKEDLGVTFHIDQGKQWRVAKLTIQGGDKLPLGSLKKQLRSIPGQPYSIASITSDRNRILEDYYSHGYTKASFSYTKSPGAKPATMDLVYNIHEGARDFVRRVIVSGLYRTRPSLVRKQITLHPGEPVSLVQMNDIARRLMDLGVFANVSAGLQNADGSSRDKYVLYDVHEADRYSFHVGLGLQVGQFGGTTSLLSQAGGANGVSPLVSFDVSRVNFRGTGETVSLQTSYSTLQQHASLNYIFPRVFGSPSRSLIFSGIFDTTQDVQTFSGRREEASVQLSQRFNRASTLQFRYAYRRVSTSNVEIPSLLIPQFLQPVRIGMFSFDYIQDHRDNPADAHHGFWNTLDAGLASSYFGSQRNFLRVLARNATYTSLGHNMVLARQTQIGEILPFHIPAGLNRFDAVPLPERFFGGGSVSMRGFGDNQAGPRDIGTPNEIPGMCTQPACEPTGFPIGGNALFFNNVELRFPLLGTSVQGVLFEDMGNIFNTLSDISLRYHQRSLQDFNYTVQAPGFGIRYKTPFGPVRVDFSYALNPPRFLGFNVDETIQDLLTCSPDQVGHSDLCTPSPQRLGHFQFFFSIGQAF
ncbi:MAG: POTRA domain-containing protein [Bryobacteraceae bacterium]